MLRFLAFLAVAATLMGQTSSQYSFPFLAPREYRIEASMAGFSTSASSAILGVTERIAVNFVLNPAGVTEENIPQLHPTTCPVARHLRPAERNADVSINKKFTLTERVNLEWRSALFNVLNIANFANPGGSITAASYGGIRNTTGNPRVVQFALKLAF